MPKTLACNLRVEFVPLPKEREAAWMYAMGLIREMLHQAREQAQAELKEEEKASVTQ